MAINITLSISDMTIDSLPNISETKDGDILDDFKDYFNDHKIDFIKIDTEGFEYEV